MPSNIFFATDRNGRYKDCLGACWTVLLSLVGIVNPRCRCCSSAKVNRLRTIHASLFLRQSQYRIFPRVSTPAIFTNLLKLLNNNLNYPSVSMCLQENWLFREELCSKNDPKVCPPGGSWGRTRSQLCLLRRFCRQSLTARCCVRQEPDVLVHCRFRGAYCLHA